MEQGFNLDGCQFARLGTLAFGGDAEEILRRVADGTNVGLRLQAPVGVVQGIPSAGERSETLREAPAEIGIVGDKQKALGRSVQV